LGFSACANNGQRHVDDKAEMSSDIPAKVFLNRTSRVYKQILDSFKNDTQKQIKQD
jgi:hypothetical protein